MPQYTYKIVTAENQVKGGTTSARSQAAATKMLKQDGSTVLLLMKNQEPGIWYHLKNISFGFSKFEQIVFFRNLASMISSGVSIIKALEVSKEQIRSAGVKLALTEMISSIQNGQKLSTVFAAHPRYFSSFMIETIAVGESSGRLPETLERICQNLEHTYELRRRVISAITYPIIVVLVMFVVMVTLVTFVLPKIASVYADAGVSLPFLTTALLSISHFITNSPFLLGSAIILLAAGAVLMYKSKPGRLFVDNLMIRMPIFGSLVVDYNLARFLYSIDVLLASGTSIVKATDIAKKTLNNTVYQKALDTIYPILFHGVPLTDTLRAYPLLFPLQMRRMIEVGEQTGNMEQSIKRVASYYDQSIAHKTQVLTTLIEPILMILAAVMVGGLALSIFLPIYQIANAI